MQRPLTEQELIYTEDELALFEKALTLQQFVKTPGWKLVYERLGEMESAKMLAALKVGTDDTAKAMDALRQWQVAHELVSEVLNYIEGTIDAAHKQSPQNPLEEAILQESLNGRRNADGDPVSGF